MRKLSTGNLNIESVTRDLYEVFQSEEVQDKNARIDDYFEALMRKDEMSGNVVSITKYSDISNVIKQDVMPLYHELETKTKEVEKKKADMVWWKYVGGTVLFFEVVGTIVTRGQDLRLPMIVTTVLPEALVGYGVFKAVQYFKGREAVKAENKFFKAVKSIDKQFMLEQKYRSMQEVMDGDLLKAETYGLLDQYSRPEQFWKDYNKVRKKDPTTERDLAELKVDNFGGFLKMHVAGAYNQVKRQNRFDALFVEAHKFFANKYPNYISKQTENY